MHSYLSSIGFSNIKNRRLLAPVLKDLISSPTKRTISTISADTRMIQINKDFGDGFGLSFVGELDIEGNVSYEYYFPYLKSPHPMCQDRIYIEKHGDKESYSGVCEDYNLGMTLIFFVTNVGEYENTKWMNYSNHLINRACLSGLSNSGKIILDIEPDEKSKRKDNSSFSTRKGLIEAARQGDKSAMENLTLDVMDTYDIVSRRIKNEDVLSIVETNFMPYGIENEHYAIIGKILDTELKTNTYSNEEIYILAVETNDVIMNVAINKKDLLGEPLPGRRFKGEIWLQGHVFF